MSWLALPEVAAALAICGRVGKFTNREAQLAYRQLNYDLPENVYQLVPVTLAIAKEAGDLTQRCPLKGYDAVQVSTALAVARHLQALDEELVFVRGDRQTLEAAQSEALLIGDPFEHTDLDTTP